MNRAQRRKNKKQDQRREELWKFGEARRVNKDMCAIDVHLIRRDSFIRGVISGHANAERLVIPIADFLNRSASSTRGHGPMCLSCETEFTASEVPIDFLITGLNTGRQLIMTGICSRCSAQSDDWLMQAGMKQVKKIWTDAVELPKGGEMH